MAREPCLACGEETAAGSPLYPGRSHVLRPDGTPIFLCDWCTGQVRIGQPTGLDEADLLRLHEVLPPTGILAAPRLH